MEVADAEVGGRVETRKARASAPVTAQWARHCVYADHSAVDHPKGEFVLAGKANLKNEPAVDQLCGDQKGKHRFGLDIPNQALTTHRGRELYVNGFVAGVEGVALAGSGAKRFPDPPVFRDVPESLPLSPAAMLARRSIRVFSQRPRISMTWLLESMSLAASRHRVWCAWLICRNRAPLSASPQHDSRCRFT
jgi:hypothetical protein